jgi:hypothetical protein
MHKYPTDASRVAAGDPGEGFPAISENNRGLREIETKEGDAARPITPM